MVRTTTRLIVALGVLLVAAPASAQLTYCKISYQLKGWSCLYKTTTGSARIECSNWQSAKVALETHGGGATFGQFDIVDGRGAFSGVRDIDELVGRYFEANAHGGMGGAGDARLMMKSNATLSLAGAGQGINIGFAFGSFKISRM
jgi:hypothetical protein